MDSAWVQRASCGESRDDLDANTWAPVVNTPLGPTPLQCNRGASLPDWGVAWDGVGTELQCWTHLAAISALGLKMTPKT